jgi:riboflavin kinase/FMN adenylyltransferase
MQTHTFPNIPALGPLAVTTGFFDGVHCGHQAVIRQLLRAASTSGLPACVVTYHPHPRVVLGKDEGLQLLTCFEEKQQRLATLGVDHLIVIPFTKELAALDAEIFFQQYLAKSLNTKQLIVGYDHNMGKNAAADFDTIKKLCNAHNVEAMQVSACTQNEVEVSSTKIRDVLREGNIAAANAMLGYAYSLHGRVVGGSRIGRQIGFPTANIAPDCTLKMLPKSGAYAVLVQLGGRRYSGMLNVGARPTVSSDNSRSMEVHIFDFSQDIYSSEITVTLVERLRDERKMESLEELKKQLCKDEKAAREILR